MTFKEFSGKNVEEAIRAAMKEFGADLGDLDIEILAQGSRGILGVGSDEARILAAPKSAVAEASSLRTDAPEAADRAPAPPAEHRHRMTRRAPWSRPMSRSRPRWCPSTTPKPGLTPVMADETPAPPATPPRGRGRGADSGSRREPRADRAPRA